LSRIESSTELKDFVKSVRNLNPDWHEGSGSVEGVVTGTILDNEGGDKEILITIVEKKNHNNAVSIKLATLLSLVTREVI
jgi:hypothetical protein